MQICIVIAHILLLIMPTFLFSVEIQNHTIILYEEQMCDRIYAEL